MSHESKVIYNSNGKFLERHGQGVSFRIRCCDDPATDEVHHIMRAAGFTKDELLTKIRREYLEPHAQAHEAAEKLFNAVEVEIKDCGCNP